MAIVRVLVICVGVDVNIDHLAPWLSLPVGGGECEAVVCASVQGEGLVSAEMAALAEGKPQW